MNWRLFWSPLMAGLLWLGLTLPLHAQSPAALIMDVAGGSHPELEPFGEVFPGESYTLEDGTEVAFMHYATCGNVLVQGGRITFTQRQYLVKGGKIVEATRGKCPKDFKMASANQTGGVVLRASGKPTVSTRPDFVLVGAKRAHYSQMSIEQGGNVVLKTPLSGVRFSWPADQAPLTPDTKYTVQLWPADGGKPKSVSLTVVERRGTQPITLLRVD